MKNIYYNIHELLGIKISSLSWHLIKDLNCLYSYFEGKGDSVPDISVEIGHFVPDLSECFSLDHKYFIKKDFIFVEDNDKKLRWKVQIEGLEQERMRIKFLTPKTTYARFPWMFFPDLVLHIYVLQPLIEMLLLRKGCMLVHAGAVSRKGKSYLIAGRGGSHKTNFVMGLMKRGYNYISDDMVILNGKEVLSFPHSVSLFDFAYRYLGREDMNLLEKVRLFFFLRKSQPLSFKVVERSKIEGLTLLILTNKPSIEVRNDFDRQGALRMLLFNQMMERTSYVSHKTIIGKYLEAYRFVFPDSKLFANEKEREKLLERSFQGVPFKVVEVPRRWESHFIEKLEIGQKE